MSTEIQIKSEGALTGRVKVFMPDGSELKGIASIAISPMNPNEIITAKVELLAAIDLRALPRVTMMHPVNGEMKEVKRIEFADGSSWEMPE